LKVEKKEGLKFKVEEKEGLKFKVEKKEGLKFKVEGLRLGNLPLEGDAGDFETM